MSKKYLAIFLSSIFIIIFLTSNNKAAAIQLFTPFGGEVKSWDPAPASCWSDITAPIAAATAFTVWVTVEKLEVSGPAPATLGVLRVEGATLPFLTNIYKYYTYFIPGSKVVGNSLDLCGLCKATGQIPLAKEICKIPGISDFTSVACKLTGSTCPIGNLVYNIGVSNPASAAAASGVDQVTKQVTSKICSGVSSLPVIGDLLSALNSFTGSSVCK